MGLKLIHFHIHIYRKGELSIIGKYSYYDLNLMNTYKAVLNDCILKIRWNNSLNAK